MSKKGGKMLQLVNYRLRVTLTDSRALTGQMLAYDKHMNLVLADCEEFRTLRKKKKGTAAPSDLDDGPQEIKRTLGLVILRGESIVSLSVEGPPPAPKEDPTAGLVPGPGKAMGAGRGLANMPPPMMRGQAQNFSGPPGMPGMPGMPPPGFGGFGAPPPGFPQGGPPPGFAPPPGFGGR